MDENKRSARRIIIGLLAVLLLLIGYGWIKNAGTRQSDNKNPDNAADKPADRVDTGFILTGPDSFDSSDTAILVKKNKDDGTVTFYNTDKERNYTLSMDGTTRLYNKYGESISLDQLKVGDIVDVTFLKSSKHLTTMRLSVHAWKNENVSRYELDSARSEVIIGEDVFKMPKTTQYFSMGHSIEEMDLNAADVLSFQGIGSQVLSISVEKGHGYLRLENDESFVGGWIEIGQEQIRRISEDMLLVVPEGSYQVNISHRGGGGIKQVMVNRNEETILDIGDLEIPEPQTGTVIFSISPSIAKLYIDGTETDASQPVSLEYGLHQLIVKADGYKSITQYIRVGQASAGVNIELESGTSDKGTASTVSGGNVTDTSSGTYKVFVDAPEGVEAYLDGNYVGVTPCSFAKVPGAHALTLRKTGYRTRSYTIQVDSEDKDISYSFAALEVAGSTNTTSGSGSTSLGGSGLDTNSLVSDMINNVLGSVW